MHETKSFESDVSGFNAEFLHVGMLPTGFRSYKESSVYVRGLYFEESISLAKFVGARSVQNVDYAQLVNVYRDCIRGIPVESLEPIDMKTLMIISSIWTVDNFGWNPNVPCPQVDKGSDGKETPCTGVIDETIVLDDFDFSPPRIKRVPVPVKIDGNTYDIGPLTVGDKIIKQNFLQNNDDVDPTVLDYALMIKNEGMALEDKIKAIRFGNRRSVLQLKQIDDEFLIEVAPVVKKCNTCHRGSKVDIGLDKIKAYP